MSKGGRFVNKGKHTVSSIADALGVSRASVSRALNNSPGVGTELRKQILEYFNTILKKNDVYMYIINRKLFIFLI